MNREERERLRWFLGLGIGAGVVWWILEMLPTWAGLLTVLQW